MSSHYSCRPSRVDQRWATMTARGTYMSTRLRRNAGLILGVAVTFGVAACGGSTGGSATGAVQTSAAAPTTTTAAAAADNTSGGLTAPGTHLALGQPATVGWVTLDEDSGTGA